VYREQVDALVEGGVDFILVETVFDTLNAKAAIMATLEAEQALGRELPLMISMTLTDLSGRNLSGHTVEAFWASVCHARPLTIGLNCSFGAAQLRPHLAALSASADTLVMAYPNAGLPNDLGEYDEAAAETAAQVAEWVRDGLVNIVGGCCGTTPAHIAAIAEVAARQTAAQGPGEPRHRLCSPGSSRWSLPREQGYASRSRTGARSERAAGARFVNVGERTNVTGSARFKKLILAGDYDAAVEVARQQVENGAQIIDVNMDEACSIPKRR
jgi:hypothetical protein